MKFALRAWYCALFITKVSKTLAYHLRTVPNTEVKVEAPIRPTGCPARDQLRADLRVTGTASYRQATTDYEVSIVSTFAASYTQPRGAQPPNEAIQVYQLRREDVKTCKYAHLTPNGFHLIVMTASGTLFTQTSRIFKFWRKKMGPPTYSSLLMNISLGLLRIRAQNYVL